MEMSGQFNSRLLHPWEENIRYPLDRRLGEPQILFECCETEKIFLVCFYIYRELKPEFSVVQQISVKIIV
jgi:hypothetical protein